MTAKPAGHIISLPRRRPPRRNSIRKRIDMGLKILGIETSCDETAAGVVEDGRVLHSNVIASQAVIHSSYGGVVPELASRQHVRDMVPVLEKAVADAGLGFEDLDAVAVTYGPGLGGSLITGLNTAKAIAFSLGAPLIGVNHLEGHIYAAWLTQHIPDEDPGFPLMCMVASGGHTDLILMEDHGNYKLLGRTRDDAAGEAFDKAARILGLGFPGGPEIQRVLRGGGRRRAPSEGLDAGHFGFQFQRRKDRAAASGPGQGHIPRNRRRPGTRGPATFGKGNGPRLPGVGGRRTDRPSFWTQPSVTTPRESSLAAAL